VLQYAIRAFADALDAIPMALAENSGLQPIETLSAAKSQQIKVNNGFVILLAVQLRFCFVSSFSFFFLSISLEVKYTLFTHLFSHFFSKYDQRVYLL